MSATTLSQALGTASETHAAASLPHQDDEHSSLGYGAAAPTSALAIEVLHGRIGCAVFLDEEQQLLLCEDLPCDFAFDDQPPVPSARHTVPQVGNVEPEIATPPANNIASAYGDSAHGYVGSLLSQFDPELIVVSSRCPETLLDVLRGFAERRRGTIDIRPARYFQFALGLSSIEEATLFSRANGADREPREYSSNDERSMSALVMLDAKVSTSKSTLSMSSVGPLLSSLRGRREIGRSLTLSSLCLDDHLFLDENTVKSLSICSSDTHGFVHAKSGREGFSILDSQPLLRRWIMMPLARRSEIIRRHEAVELLVRLESTTDMMHLRSQLKHLGGLPQLCHKLNMGVGSVMTWQSLWKTCNAVMNIRAVLNGFSLIKSELLNELSARVVVDSVQQLADAIERTIDFKESKDSGKVTVRPGVDTHLDELRMHQKELPVQLDRVAADLRGQPAFRPTERQIGYLICVPGGETIDMMADSTLEQQFVSEEYVYLKNSRMSELDYHLGDVASFIVDKEIEILDGLQTLVKRCSPVLLAAHAALSQIDCLVAFARAATQYDLKRPTLMEEQVIHLKASRHPLKALAEQGFVPNDIDLRGGVGLPPKNVEQRPDANNERDDLVREDHQGEPRPESRGSVIMLTDDEETKYSVMVLTGANSSGKSCLLQQAALAVFLCQCGSFVPAAQAELGIFDKILTRMRQDESVASEGSSFTREMGRLHRAMAMSTKKSLVILDEVGRECRSDDGAGLFIATIYDFLERGRDCPIVLSATHHLRAIERNLPEPLPIQRAHMQTTLLPTLAHTYTSLTYLYRLRPGFAGSSHACHCARLCGVPESVVERADRIYRIGLHAWHDAEAKKDEAIVRRLLSLRLGGEDGEEQQKMGRQVSEMGDERAREWIRWVLTGDERGVEEDDELPLVYVAGPAGDGSGR
nr:DNA mismatch repair protein [Pseudozyma flocculosa]